MFPPGEKCVGAVRLKSRRVPAGSKILKKDGPGALVKASADALSDDLKLTAFACAVDISLADGVLEDEEKDIINQLAATLNIPERTAISIIEVMIIKNKA